MNTTMRTYGALALALGLAGLGCGSDDSKCGDAGACAGSGGSSSSIAGSGGAAAGSGSGTTLWSLTSDTNVFDVTAIAKVTDDCKTDAASLVGQTLPVTYDTTAHTVSVGDKQGTPEEPSLGSGVVKSNTGTLTAENDRGDLPCTWHQKDVAVLTLTANDQFTLAVTEDQSMFASGCASADVPTGGKCTSTWTWTLKKAD